MIIKYLKFFKILEENFFIMGQLIVCLEGEILTREILTVIMHRPFISPLCWIIKRTVCHCVPNDFKIWMEFQYVDSVDMFWFFFLLFFFFVIFCWFNRKFLFFVYWIKSFILKIYFTVIIAYITCSNRSKKLW